MENGFRKFGKGFLRNFVVLLLLASGIKFANEGPTWLAIICFLLLSAVIVYQIGAVKKRFDSDKE